MLIICRPRTVLFHLVNNVTVQIIKSAFIFHIKHKIPLNNILGLILNRLQQGDKGENSEFLPRQKQFTIIWHQLSFSLREAS